MKRSLSAYFEHQSSSGLRFARQKLPLLLPQRHRMRDSGIKAPRSDDAALE